MNTITTDKINPLSKKVINAINAGNNKKAVNLLKKVLDIKCPFPKLDLLGRNIGQAGLKSSKKYFSAFDQIIAYNTMGSYVVVASALIQFLEIDFEQVMQKTRKYIIKGDVWHVCDNMAERSLGQALVDYFEKTIPWLKNFLKAENVWLPRAVGVAIHFFSKRVKDEPAKTKKLLDLVKPYIETKQKDIVKGIGWGLKTIGKYHPDILIDFLSRQLKARKKLSKLILKKALTYLPKEQKKYLKT